MQEITAPLARLPEDPVPEVADIDFPLALRGYDRLAVDAYVRKTSQLVAELQATRSPDAAIRRALERVGEEVSGILQRAHETAEQITAQSRIEAEERLEHARREATEITSSADRRLAELDSETDRIWSERHRIVEDARELARQLVSLAEAAAERFPAAPEETEEPKAEQAEEPESLDRWESDEFEQWDDADEAEDEGASAEAEGPVGGVAHADPDETAATTAMPPVAPDEDGKEEPEAGPGSTEETRKLD